MTGVSDVVSLVKSDRVDESSSEFKSAEMLVLEIASTMLSEVGQMVNNLSDTISEADKQLVQQALEEGKQRLEQIQKEKEGGKLKKILDALGVVGLIIAVIMTALNPTPLTIGLLVASIVLMLEPILADAMDTTSIVEKLMSSMSEAFSKMFGEVGGAVVSGLLMFGLTIALGAGAGAGIGAALKSTTSSASMLSKIKSLIQNCFSSSSKGTSTSTAAAARTTGEGIVDVTKELAKNKELTALAEGISKIAKNFKSLFKSDSILNTKPTPAQERTIYNFIAAIQTGIMFSQGAVQIDLALIKKAAAEVKHELEIISADMGFVEDNLALLIKEIENLQESYNNITFRLLTN